MEQEKRHYLVIAIARTMGSGGSFVGRHLATRLGCTYLDREILVEAARRLNRDPEALEALDEKRLNFWERTRLNYALGFPSAAYVPPPINLEDSMLFETEAAIMREAAARGPTVVVGRAGFWVLRDEPGLLSVLLHAPLESRAERIRKIYRLDTVDKARELIEQSDRQREGFIRKVTGMGWLDCRNYTMTLDSAALGTATTIEAIYTGAMEVSRALFQRREETF